MGVCVPVHAFQLSILSVCMCVCMCLCVSVYCLRAGMDDAILLHLWPSGTWIRAQAHRRRLIGQWQHGPAHCTFLQTAGAIWHLAELRTEKTNKQVRTSNTGKWSGLWWNTFMFREYTHIYVQVRVYPPKSQGDFFQLSFVLWLSILCCLHLVLLNIMGYLVFLVWKWTKHN